MNAPDADLILTGAAIGSAAAHFYLYKFVKNHRFLIWSSLLFFTWIAVHSIFSWIFTGQFSYPVRYILSGPARILMALLYSLTVVSMYPGFLRKRDLKILAVLSPGAGAAASMMVTAAVFFPDAVSRHITLFMVLSGAVYSVIPLYVLLRTFSRPGIRRKAAEFRILTGLFILAVCIPPVSTDARSAGLTEPDLLLRLIFFAFFEYLVIRNFRMKNSYVMILQDRLKSELRIKKQSLRLTHRALDEEENAFNQKMKIASRIQDIMLPSLPWKSGNLEIDGFYMPQSEVGGDYFDIIPMKNKTAVILADASGHGVPAAFITAMAKITFSNAVTEDRSPEEILFQVNEHLTEIIKTQEYLTVILAEIDSGRMITYANVSHPPAFVARLNSQIVERWETTGGIFLGSLDNSLQTYGQVSVLLGPGDRLLFITDGLTDQQNESGEPYGMNRMEEIFRSTLHLPASAAKRAVTDNLYSFMGSAPQSDDICFLIVDIK